MIVGGDLSAAGEVLLGPLRETVRRNAIPSAVEDLEIVAGVLGERAEMLGALALVMHESDRFASRELLRTRHELESEHERGRSARERGDIGVEYEGASSRRRFEMKPAMTKKLVLLPLALIVAALGLAACGDDDDDGGGGGSGGGGGGKIAFLLPETQTARYESQDEPLFEAKVEEHCPDCEILYYNADQDPTKQQQQVETAITEEVDVMVLDPVDSTASAGLATRAKQADIPVISYDRLILDADLDYYVSFDSVEVGKQQGESLSEKLDDDGSPRARSW